MWERATTSFWRLGKRFRNSGKGIDRKNHKNNDSSGTKKHVKNKSAEGTFLRSQPFTSSLPSATHVSYLSSILSSLWPSDGAREIEKVDMKTQRIKAVSKPKSALFDQTKSFVSSLLSAETDGSVLLKTRELCKHYMEYPEARAAGFQ
ncbi:unnamed protein product, partial [Cercopithifilaria johnstoni]